MVGVFFHSRPGFPVSRRASLSSSCCLIFFRYKPYANPDLQNLSSVCCFLLVALSSVLLRSQTLLSSARAINFSPTKPDQTAETVPVDVQFSVFIIMACLLLPFIAVIKPFSVLLALLSLIKNRCTRASQQAVDLDDSTSASKKKQADSAATLQAALGNDARSTGSSISSLELQHMNRSSSQSAHPKHEEGCIRPPLELLLQSPYSRRQLQRKPAKYGPRSLNHDDILDAEIEIEFTMSENGSDPASSVHATPALSANGVMDFASASRNVSTIQAVIGSSARKTFVRPLSTIYTGEAASASQGSAHLAVSPRAISSSVSPNPLVSTPAARASSPPPNLSVMASGIFTEVPTPPRARSKSHMRDSLSLSLAIPTQTAAISSPRSPNAPNAANSLSISRQRAAALAALGPDHVSQAPLAEIFSGVRGLYRAAPVAPAPASLFPAASRAAGRDIVGNASPAAGIFEDIPAAPRLRPKLRAWVEVPSQAVSILSAAARVPSSATPGLSHASSRVVVAASLNRDEQAVSPRTPHDAVRDNSGKASLSPPTLQMPRPASSTVAAAATSAVTRPSPSASSASASQTDRDRMRARGQMRQAIVDAIAKARQPSAADSRLGDC